jgi:hypothetical protein
VNVADCGVVGYVPVAIVGADMSRSDAIGQGRCGNANRYSRPEFG